MNLPSKVKIREVATRDGFQSLKNFIPSEQKLQIIEAVVETGVTEIETTSFVSVRAIPQLADAVEVMGRVPRRLALRHSAMIPNLKGAENAIAAGVDRLVVVISASEEHNRRNVRRHREESIVGLDDIFSTADKNKTPVIGSVAVSFGCPFQGDVPEREVFDIAEAYISRGAPSVIFADTTGMASPVRVDRMVRQFNDRYPETELILHFHNNRGTAMANLLAALTAGAASFDTSLGGIGGCPYIPQATGNLPTEDVVFMLEDMGISTGIDLEKIISAARLLEDTLGYTLPGQVMKSGPRIP